MQLEVGRYYEALRARDARFDGAFFVGVSTTRVYCRPVCTARLPRRDRCTFFPSASSAEAAGYRPCLKCRPELAPGLAPIDAPRRVARVALDRIEAGALAEGGIEPLAAELGLSSRQLRRVIEREYGVPPVALEQTRRLLLAKRLLTDTPMKVVDVAFASGFGSVRRFNHLFRSRYRMNPTALRGRPVPGDRGITLKLSYRPPLDWPSLAAFLASRGSPRTERWDGRRYLRVVRLGDHGGFIAAALDPNRNVLKVEIAAALVPVLSSLLVRLRHLFDLDADPAAIESHLSRDQRLSALVRRARGLRIPGAIDGFELALRTVLGQQVSVKAATTLYGRVTAAFGTTVGTPYPELDRAPPRAEDLAGASVERLASLGLTRRRAETVKLLATRVAEGSLRLTRDADSDAARRGLLALPGVGPWTTEYVALRALGDPDAFPAGDLGLLKAMKLDRPKDLEARAEAWRPWRGYAALHLWNHLGGGG